ncbi:MAG: hypothetical protein LBQ77_02495 [Treponema sp.]|nr:hypothetical protein [Treponema sp.]
MLKQWAAGLADTEQQSAFDWNEADCTATIARIMAFLNARAVYEINNSTQNRIAKDEAKVEAIRAMRDFANTSIRFNKKMKDEDKLVYGIRPADTKLTTHAPPTSQPSTEVLLTLNHYQHRVNALSHGVRATSKPADAYGVRYAWQIGGGKPASGADLPKTQFSRKTSYTVIFTEADKGKTVYYATCYENSKGQTGPWSPVTEAIIA